MLYQDFLVVFAKKTLNFHSKEYKYCEFSVFKINFQFSKMKELFIKPNQRPNHIIIRFKEIQMQNFNWKQDCLAQWDQECKRVNAELLGIKIKQDEEQTFDTSSSQNQSQIIHKIKHGQTLWGISLLYQVDPESIKRRNNLYSDQIYFLRQLIISHPRRRIYQIRELSKQEKIHQVMKRLNFNENQVKLAERILDQSSWNIDRTIEKYKADIQWQRSFAPIINSMMSLGIKCQ